MFEIIVSDDSVTNNESTETVVSLSALDTDEPTDMITATATIESVDSTSESGTDTDYETENNYDHIFPMEVNTRKSKLIWGFELPTPNNDNYHSAETTENCKHDDFFKSIWNNRFRIKKLNTKIINLGPICGTVKKYLNVYLKIIKNEISIENRHRYSIRPFRWRNSFGQIAENVDFLYELHMCLLMLGMAYIRQGRLVRENIYNNRKLDRIKYYRKSITYFILAEFVLSLDINYIFEMWHSDHIWPLMKIRPIDTTCHFSKIMRNIARLNKLLSYQFVLRAIIAKTERITENRRNNGSVNAAKSARFKMNVTIKLLYLLDQTNILLCKTRNMMPETEKRSNKLRGFTDKVFPKLYYYLVAQKTVYLFKWVDSHESVFSDYGTRNLIISYYYSNLENLKTAFSYFKLEKQKEFLKTQLKMFNEMFIFEKGNPKNKDIHQLLNSEFTGQEIKKWYNSKINHSHKSCHDHWDIPERCNSSPKTKFKFDPRLTLNNDDLLVFYKELNGLLEIKNSVNDIYQISIDMINL